MELFLVVMAMEISPELELRAGFGVRQQPAAYRYRG